MSIQSGMSHYPHGFQDGVSVRGLPILNAYSGRVWWVHNTIGANGNTGKTPERPFKTLNYAIGRTTASSTRAEYGDIIMVMPGHTESITAAGGVALDKAGVYIAGMGHGTFMPTFTLTAAASSVTVSADNCLVQGIKFVGGIGDMVHVFDVTATNLEIAFCDFDGTGFPMLSCVTMDTDDNDSDRLNFHHNMVYVPGNIAYTNPANVISIAKDMDAVRIEDNYIKGHFTDAAIDVPAGGNASTLLCIDRNYIINGEAGQHCIQVNGAAVTGICYDNRLSTDAQATCLDTALLQCSGNTWTDLVTEDVEGVPVNPIMDAATNLLGADDAANLGVTTNVVADGDGSVLEREEYIQTQVDKIDQVTLDTTPTAASLATFIATGGTALGTQLPASTSLYDSVRAYGIGYMVSKVYADLTGYDTVPAFTVTGDVMARVVGVVGDTAITCTSTTSTLSVGTTEDAVAIIPAAIMNGALFAATDVWVDATPNNDCEIMPSNSWHIIGGSADIILTRNVDDITAGNLTLYCFWTPLSADGAVVAA